MKQYLFETKEASNTETEQKQRHRNVENEES